MYLNEKKTMIRSVKILNHLSYDGQKKVLLQALNLRPATEIISSFNSMKRLGVLLPMARRDASPLQVIPKHVQQVAVHNNFQLPVY